MSRKRTLPDAAAGSTAARRDRLPPIPPAQMTPEQRQAAREISRGPRGAVVGPFVAALRSPEFMRRLQQLGAYLRFDNALGPRLTEFVILFTARRWTQQFEWSAHVPLALEQGLARRVIDAIGDGRRPNGMTREEAIIYEFLLEMDRRQSVSDATYDRAVTAFGEQAVVDLIGIIGYYSMLAMILNVAQTPAPAGAVPRLEPFPNP